MPPRLDYTEIEINLRLNIITTNAARHLKLRMDLRVLCNDGVLCVLYFWRNKGAVLFNKDNFFLFFNSKEMRLKFQA